MSEIIAQKESLGTEYLKFWAKSTENKSVMRKKWE